MKTAAKHTAFALLALLAGCSMLKTSHSFGVGTGGGNGSGGGGGGGGETSSTEGGGGGGGGGGNGSDVIEVPNLIGKTREEAAAAVRAAGFTQEMESTRPVECDEQGIEGKVKCQDPEPGTKARRYTMIQVQVFKQQRIAGAIVRSQLLSLIGMSPDEARAALKRYGHKGTVKVKPATDFVKGCAEGKVCSFDVAESGISDGDPITLFTNRAVEIGGPPPE